MSYTFDNFQCNQMRWYLEIFSYLLSLKAQAWLTAGALGKSFRPAESTCHDLSQVIFGNLKKEKQTNKQMKTILKTKRIC